MSWERNKGLLVGIAVTLAAAGVAHFVVAGPRRAAAEDAERANAETRAQIVLLDPKEFIGYCQEQHARLQPAWAWSAKQAEKSTAEFKAFVKARLADYVQGAPEPATAESVATLVGRCLAAGSAGQPQPEALKAVLAERKQLQDKLKRANGLLLVIPERYVVPKSDPDPALFFEKQLSLLRERCATGRYPKYVPDGACPVGLSNAFRLREPDVKALLERLAAADRLTAAVDAAGLIRVVRITHGTAAAVSAPGVAKVHLRELPLTLEAVADEKSLTEFVKEISQEGRFLALQTLEVTVTDPKSRTFNIKAEVLALLERAGAGPKSPGGSGPGTGPAAPAVGRY